LQHAPFAIRMPAFDFGAAQPNVKKRSMKIILALLIGVAVGACAVWFYSTKQGKSTVRATGEQIESSTKAARDTIQEKLRVLDLRPDQVKEDLARTGQVVRRKAREAGQAIADATADARITGAIKAKILANRDLSALSISVNTTSGIVTLSGTVSSPEDISKAMLLAMDTDGVTEVISTLQVRSPAKK
jgi:hyperosmotically inducible periplasmic protein